MRVISQDGTIDIPYELTSIQLVSKTTIIAQGSYFGSSSDDNFVTVAEYSTEAKAQKAMEMLRDTYQYGKRVAVPKFDESGIEDEDDLLLFNTRFINDCLSEGVRVQSKYFQFPKDEDVEV